MKKLLYLSIPIILIVLIIYASMSSRSIASNILYGKEYYYNNDKLLNEDGTIMTTNSSNGTITGNANSIDTNKNSITVLVNKEFSLPSDYIPEDLVVPDILFNINYYDEKKLMRQEAATAIEQLFAAAVKEGLKLYGISGYRSYDRQKEIYDTNVATKGADYTNRYSARPGHSEHQTGLVMDVSTSSIGNQLEPVFAYTPEGKWLAKNAHLYGFIIRYPEGKESITGYSYEPWHIRYVGKNLARYLYDKGLTLEEYYNYTPAKISPQDVSYDNVVDVDDSDEKKELVPPTEKEINDLNEPEASPIDENSKNKKSVKKDKGVENVINDPLPEEESSASSIDAPIEEQEDADQAADDNVENIPNVNNPPIADDQEILDNETMPDEILLPDEDISPETIQ